METEKSIAKSEAEKRSIDLSGHSERQIDQNLNIAVTDPQTNKTPRGGIFSIFQAKKKKEQVLLDIRKK